MSVRTVAFLLPQFHPIPENDAWWGEGFTEWTNVRKAEPLFEGHEQPRVPADLGYYDLLDPAARAAQAALAADHGIDAFCYYHYWFHGKELLEQPLRAVLASGEPDFPFFVCWANENWTRRWDRGEQHVLQPQRYSADDDVDHIRSLLPVFADPRYVRLGGAAVFVVYQVHQLPEPARTAERWRAEVAAAGLGELHLVSVDGHNPGHPDPAAYGFDATVRTVPAGFAMPVTGLRAVGRRVRAALGIGVDSRLSRMWRKSAEVSGPRRVDYGEFVDAVLRREHPPWVEYPTVMPGWDNTPRVQRRGLVFTGSTPETYGRWLAAESADVRARHGDDTFVFVNAWNEWAEGAYMEPCQRWGRGYLEAHRSAVAPR